MLMRTHLLSAALAVAAIAPDAALAQSGHAELVYTNQSYDFGGVGFDPNLVSVGGQVAFDAGPVGVQIDGRYTNWGGDADDVDAFGVGAHVYKRNESWLFGGYLGYEDIDDFNAELLTGALETQWYFDRATLSGVLSHSIWDGPDYAITMLEGEYRHFLSDNFTVHVGLGVGQGDIGASDPDLWGGEIGAEYMFAGAPVSVFGGYRYSNLDFGVGEIEVDALSVGVRYNWSGSLRERSRSGAGLNRVLHVLDRFLS